MRVITYSYILFHLSSKESDWKSYVERPIAGWKNIWNTFIAVFALVFLRIQMEFFHAVFCVTLSYELLHSSKNLLNITFWSQSSYYAALFKKKPIPYGCQSHSLLRGKVLIFTGLFEKCAGPAGKKVRFRLSSKTIWGILRPIRLWALVSCKVRSIYWLKFEWVHSGETRILSRLGLLDSVQLLANRVFCLNKTRQKDSICQ